MAYEIRTKRGYDLLDVASALQKTIRRSNTKLAGYFAQELVASGYSQYAWKRLLTISAEDCHGVITTEIHALYKSFELVNKGKAKGVIKGRIFISKAVIILSESLKSRDADHLQCLVYDKKISISDAEIEKEITKSDLAPNQVFPDYVFDTHTKRGRIAGKTKHEFFIEEYVGLKPKQLGLFDELHSMY